MNKLKFFYDVVKTMQEQERWQGAFQVEAEKDRMKILDLAAQFDKNLATGHTQSQIKTEFSYNGQTMKHESSNEFNLSGKHGCCCRIHQKMKEHLHGCAWHETDGQNCCGIKAKLEKIALLLQLLSAFKLEEQADQSFVLSINSADFSEKLQQDLLEKLKQHRTMIQQHCDGEHSCGCKLFKELSKVETHDFELIVSISPDYTVSKVILTGKVTGTSDQNVPVELRLKAELNLYKTN